MRSLNQHKVFVEKEDGQMVHCGYIGDAAFLPLSGFPGELSTEIAKYATEQLGRPIGTVDAPPSLSAIQQIAEKQTDEGDE
jgi:hypothetical protein